MNKRVFVILFCIGSVLWMNVAHAEQSGIGGEIAIGGGAVIGRVNQLDSKEGDRRINRRDQKSDSETIFFPIVTGELNYTLNNDRTTLFIGTLGTRDQSVFSGLAAGLRHASDHLGYISAAATIESNKVWQDPYLLGKSRSLTDETGFGFSFGIENILGTGLLIDSHIMEVDVDKDRIGDREKSLRRDGCRSDFSVGYAIDLSETQQIIPSVVYTRSDMKGEANSSDGITAAVRYQWGKGPWGIEVGAGAGRIKSRKVHPVYKKQREMNIYNASGSVAYEEPFGWSQVTIFGGVNYNRIDENIDSFDSDLWSLNLGVAYDF